MTWAIKLDMKKAFDYIELDLFVPSNGSFGFLQRWDQINKGICLYCLFFSFY